MAYWNTVKNVVSAVEGTGLRSTKVGPRLIADGEGVQGIADEWLVREVLGQSNVGNGCEGTTEGMSDCLQSVIRILCNERLDFSNDGVVYSGPRSVNTSHDLHVRGESHARKLGGDESNVNIVHEVGDYIN